ncbi:MAG: RsmF rRNA methyltransferase first C-terminal domain-containing protein [Firmicutes bacterium]|nr:RsmF rRNA methyltransferase first C-terminal domain-containing protein [Bacillota bacterium]
MKLPDEFLEKMKALMNEKEYEEFVLSFDMPRHYGLRVNTLKTSVSRFIEISPFKLEKVPWTKDGFYYNEGDNPGKHPFYHAGLYYIQEPSAMLPAEVLDAKPGEYILDLCAAPGGKTVQIAAGMMGEGLLVANDSNPARVKVLVKNIELCGIRNAIVTNELPCNLAVKFPEFFDKILVDAPCSGEGMFRKDENAVKSWGKYKCEDCFDIQKDILESADKMLKPGGRLVYSTCTFSLEENEEVISSFLKKHDNYELLEVPLPEGAERGRPEWAGGDERIAKAIRLWPHKVRGEGHFVVLLAKKGQNENYLSIQEKHDELKKMLSKEYLEIFKEFMHNNLNMEIEGHFTLTGNNLYCLSVPLPDLNGIKVVKFGWYLGRFSKSLMGTNNLKNMFEPSHSMIMSLRKGDLKNVADFPSESTEIIKYLKGETLLVGGEKGLIGVCVDGFTVGWAKQTGKMLKNLYPHGWRQIPSGKKS